MGKACDECTQNCLTMHKRDKNPASVVTTFFKVMMGDDYSKTLYLPPKFASSVEKLVGETTYLEDLIGEKCYVKCTKIDGRLAFEEGWNTFALNHRLQKGDVLVFHCIKKTHFVVLMYGPTGCPENRHFGFPHHPVKETKKSNNNLIETDQSSLKVHTNCNNLSHESSSKSEPAAHGVNNMKKINKKLNEPKMPSNENITSDTHHLVASSSQPVDKEMDQRSELVVKNTFPDHMYSDSPPTVNPFCLVDNDAGPELDECRRKSLQPSPVVESDGGQKNKVAASGSGSDETEINRTQKEVGSNSGMKSKAAVSGDGSDETEINKIRKLVEPNGGQKKSVVASADGSVETDINRIRKLVELDGGLENVAASGGGPDETKINRTRKWLETQMVMAAEKRKEGTMIQSEVANNNSMHKRSRPANAPTPPAKNFKREVTTSASRLHNSGHLSASTGISPKSMAKRMEPIKKEPTMNHVLVGSVKKEPAMNRGSGGLIKREPIKKEPTMNHVLIGSVKKEPAMNRGSGGLIKREPKPEPVDYDEAPLSGSSNPSFSATMSGYQYLELPGSVKLKSKVILLKNGADLWPVLYQSKYGLKALTQNWSIFAKEKGINLGDKCNFVLESEPNSRFACNVFRVDVTRRQR